MSKSAILTSLAMVALGYTKDRIGSHAKKTPISKLPTVTVAFMDWAHWLNFDEETLAVFLHFQSEYLESLQFNHIILPNPFPESYLKYPFSSENVTFMVGVSVNDKLGVAGALLSI